LALGYKKTKKPSLAMDKFFHDGVHSHFWGSESPTSGDMTLEVLALSKNKKQNPSLLKLVCQQVKTPMLVADKIGDWTKLEILV